MSYNNIIIDFEKFPHHELSRFSKNGKRFYNTVDGPTPSVTTILSATQPEEKKRSLKQWKERVGEAEAERIVKYSCDVGTLAHSHIQSLLIGDDGLPGSNPIRVSARAIGESHLEFHWKNVTHIFGIENDLAIPGLYAGATDCIGVIDGCLAIIDIKTARKAKTDEHVKDYFLQVAAYAMAFEHMYGEPIHHGVIALTTHSGTNQRWYIQPDAMATYKNEFIDRVDAYYSM